MVKIKRFEKEVIFCVVAGTLAGKGTWMAVVVSSSSCTVG